MSAPTAVPETIAQIRPLVEAASGRPPKAKLPVCGKPSGAQRTKRAPNGRPYGAPGSDPHRLGPRVGAAIGRPPKAKLPVCGNRPKRTGQNGRPMGAPTAVPECEPHSGSTALQKAKRAYSGPCAMKIGHMKRRICFAKKARPKNQRQKPEEISCAKRRALGESYEYAGQKPHSNGIET